MDVLSPAALLDPSRMMTCPPPGAVNVAVGKAVDGPGGTWVPCVTEVAAGVFWSGVFEVGPGRHQVCDQTNLATVEDAFGQAKALAASAAA